jgi:hypothetical protein
MVKAILFVGAGASAGLDMPTTQQFIEKLRQRWQNMESVLKNFRKYHQADKTKQQKQETIDSEYLRDWLIELRKSAVSIQNLSQNEPFKTNVSRTEHAEKFINAIIENFDAFTRDCYTEVNPDKAYQHYKPLLSVFERNERIDIPVFTTNYDLVFESMEDSELCEWHIETGMHQTGRRVLFDNKIFQQKYSGNSNRLLIYKLHGSTDWWINKDTRKIQQIPLDHQAPKNCLELLIYPTREKFEKINEKPFSYNYDKLRKYFTSQGMKVCIVIGYSFRDRFINDIFYDCLKQNLKLLIFDNNLKEGQFYELLTNKGDKELLKDNIQIHNLEFGNWPGNPNKVRQMHQIIENSLYI